MADDISLTQAEYALILHDYPWIRSVDPHANLSRGWAGILVELLDALDIVMDDVAADHPDAHVGVVDFSTTANFGTLRVFFALAGVSDPPNVVWRLLRATIERAEGRSARSCERCGGPGRLRDVGGRLATLCDAHGRGHGEGHGEA